MCEQVPRLLEPADTGLYLAAQFIELLDALHTNRRAFGFGFISEPTDQPLKFSLLSWVSRNLDICHP